MEKLIKDVLQSENGEEMEVRGIISDLSEGLTKTGKPFVNGQIFAKGDTMPIKVWDTGLEAFKAEKGVNIGTPVLCHGAININPQNGEKQLVLRDGNELPALSILNEEEIANLSQATQKPIKEMVRALLGNGVAGRFLPDFGEEKYGALYGIGLRAMQEVEAAAEAPYSCEIRHYKGGFVEHIYNVIYKMLYPVGLPQVEINWGVIYIAVLLYHIGWIKRTKINPVTGLVEEKDDLGPVEMGSDGVCDFAYVMSLIPERSLKEPMVRNLRHCIASLNGLVAPASIEAEICSTFVKEELRTEMVAEATKNLPSGMKGMKIVNGEVRNFINF